MRRMPLSRFERKILAAMIVVALMPLVAALLLGREVLLEAYQVGVNPRVRSALERSLEVYRTHFVTLRQAAQRSALAISDDWQVRRALREEQADRLDERLQALLERYPDVVGVRVLDSEDHTLAEARRQEQPDGDAVRSLTLREPTGPSERGAAVEVTVATPASRFREYREAGELVEVFARLQAGTGFVSTTYLLIYIALLLSVILVALGIALIISRRVTRRINLLADATARVGAGDLTVSVPADHRDEVGELTRAFNEMVRDLRESRERIEYLQRIGAWQQFARRLAHEIKNPLTPIQLAVQELDRSYRGDDPRYRRVLGDSVAIVDEEVATLRRLVSEFSAFAKLPEAHLEPADLNEFTRDAARSLSAIDEEYRARHPDAVPVQLELDLHAEPLPVRIDSMMLKRGVDNLVRNAMQALRTQGKPGRVRVRTARDARHALFEVADDGPGIAAIHRPRVFDPYFTTKNEGTGLGLAIVKKVVLEHGGEIEYHQSDMGGAAFRIRLPLAGGNAGKAQ